MCAEFSATEKHPGVNAWAILLLGVSLIWLLSPYTRLSFYAKSFQCLPEKVVMMRYAISFLGRVVGLVCGVGIFCRKDFFRKMAILLFCVMIVSVPWRHPQALFDKAVATVMSGGGAENFRVLPAETWVMVSRMVVCLTDVILSVLFVWYFTRPRIKDQFN